MTTTPAIRIKSSRPGFRRAGIAHAVSWTVYPAGTLSAAQLAELQAEPMLSVEVIDTESPDAPVDPAVAPPAGDASPAGAAPEQPESESGKPEGADQLAAAAASTVAASAAPTTAPKASAKKDK